MSKLLQNAIYVPEDDLFLVSCHTHDYVQHTLSKEPKLIVAIDGGTSYGRRTGDLYELSEAGRYDEYCLVEGEPFEGWITDRLLWGTLGKDGKGPMTYRTIKELAARPEGERHLRAILLNATPGPWHRRVIQYWLDTKAAKPS